MRREDEDRRLADRQVPREEIDAAVAALVEQFPQVEAVWLFGSYARGEERRSSDIDFAVMTARELCGDWSHRAGLRDALEATLRVPVDVVLVSAQLPLLLLWEIFRAPRLLYARDASAAAAFASGMRALVREDWPRMERRWERGLRWAREQTGA